MNTLIGLIVGVVATVAVGHYYFRRTTRKSLGVYQTLVSQTFAGIEPDVRKRLRFTYRDQEVENLLQLQFLVANDGERAISNVIEPLRLDLPEDVELLDASILHRHPEALDARIFTEDREGATKAVRFHFPLLNKGDFFLVKLLVNGKIKPRDLVFRLLADDLPRTIASSWLPPTAFEERKFRLDWGPIVAGVVFGLAALWVLWAFSVLYALRPEMFPYPWATYSFTLESLLLLPGALLFLALALIALLLMIIGGFAEFPPSGTRFPLPKELRMRGFRYPPHLFPHDLDQESRPDDETTRQDGAA